MGTRQRPHRERFLDLMDTSIGAQFEGYTQVNRKDRAKLLTDGTPGRRRSLTAEITGGYVAAVRHVAALPARHANTARHHTSLPATRVPAGLRCRRPAGTVSPLSLIHISEPTRRTPISYAVFCL